MADIRSLPRTLAGGAEAPVGGCAGGGSARVGAQQPDQMNRLHRSSGSDNVSALEVACIPYLGISRRCGNLMDPCRWAAAITPAAADWGRAPAAVVPPPDVGGSLVCRPPQAQHPRGLTLPGRPRHVPRASPGNGSPAPPAVRWATRL